MANACTDPCLGSMILVTISGSGPLKNIRYPPCSGLPSSIELEKQPMALAAGDEVVVNADRLFRDELVCRHVHTLG